MSDGWKGRDPEDGCGGCRHHALLVGESVCRDPDYQGEFGRGTHESVPGLPITAPSDWCHHFERATSQKETSN